MGDKIKFFSRKNNVFLVAKSKMSYVEKIFASEDKFRNEKHYYKLLLQKKMNVPVIYWCDDEKTTINYEYIKGELLSTLLGNGDEKSFAIMGTYLQNFHKMFAKGNKTVIAGDVNLRNFVVRDGEIVPLDYEDYRLGKAEEDVSTFLSHLVSHREVPIHVRKAMGKKFLNNYYYVSTEGLKEDIILKARRLADWRGFGELEKEIVLLVKDLF